MAAGLDSQRLGLVFQSRPDILEGIKAAADSPARVKLFNNIANFVHDQLQTNSEPAAKRRRVDEGPAANGAGPQGANGADASQEQVLLEIKEISVSVPQRKKFELCFTAKHLYARAPGTEGPAQGIVYAWQDIEYAFFLPVPGKSQVQHNYVLFPKGSCLASLKGTAPDPPEPLVFTIPATAPKQGTIGGSDAAQAATHSDDYHTLFHWALRTRLRAAGSPVNIVSADPNKFHSAIPQSHRPKEKAVHVGAFRGSKDGFLFFLENGILWGFKKPLLFIPLERVAAVSYTSVLQRTFNVVVEVFTGQGDAVEEVEFGMIDQADYEGIDESYVKRNRLQDRSMAERRKAKLELAENREVKKEGEEKGEGAGEQVSALGAAQMEDEQRLQDEEDDEEEDYDPGSEDDSDGSGSSSEEDEDEEEGDEEREEYDEEEGEEEEGEDDAEGEVEAEAEVEVEEPEDDEMKEEEEEEEEDDVKREEPASITQAGLAAEDEDELAGVPYNGQYDEMELEETFDVVG